jgi:CRISPR-associated protein Cst2
MIKHCAVTDIAGALYAEKAVARKSCAEFGWVVGLPESTVTEQYFHVKYDPGRGKSAGGDSVQGKQAIFHRPASSGIYAIICNLDLGRIGLNDITRRDEIDAVAKKLRSQALLRALAASLVHPTGAQRNTQAPHILACEGIVTWSGTSLPAPALSPLQDDYTDQVEKCVAALGAIAGAALQCQRFGTMAEAVELLTGLAAKLEMPAGGAHAPQANP